MSRIVRLGIDVTLPRWRTSDCGDTVDTTVVQYYVVTGGASCGVNARQLLQMPEEVLD